MAVKTKKTSTARTTRAQQRALLKLSPFELKDKLMSLADETSRESAVQMLNAGRGNPNWICTTPREAFGTLLTFGIEDSRLAIKTSGSDPSSIRTEARRPSPCLVFERTANWMTVRTVPDSHTVITTTGYDALTVTTEGDEHDGAGMAL